MQGETALDECVATFEEWLYLPDPTHLYVVLAAAVANLMEGDPFWLMLVGPPSSGKTEAIQTLSAMPWAYSASTLTKASLLSGTPKREAKDAKGGLLNEVGDFGVLVMKDFTSTLTQDHNAQAEALSALREVYDGHWTRLVGTDGGRTLSWEGKLGLIAGCTPAIDSHHSVIDAMGNRFMFYRIAGDTTNKATVGALGRAGQETKMRAALTSAVVKVLDVAHSRFDIPRDLTQAETVRISDLAEFATTTRSAVERDTYTRDQLAVPEAEAPIRFALQLRLMLLALEKIEVEPDVIWEILGKMALDAMPTSRRLVLEYLRQETTPRGTGAVAAAVALPSRTTRRVLEDLNALKTVNRFKIGDREDGADLWAVADWTTERWPIDLVPIFPIHAVHTEGFSGTTSDDFRNGVYEKAL